jgi:hypothetical protein
MLLLSLIVQKYKEFRSVQAGGGTFAKGTRLIPIGEDLK